MASAFFLGVAALLGAVLLWGLVSPRSQWRVLVGWSTRDPDRAEPGDGIHGLTRIICLAGLVGLLVVGAQLWARYSEDTRPGLAKTAVERMWGSPAPQLIDRLVTPVVAPPEGFPSGPIVGYQELERGAAPDYLVNVQHWSFLGEDAPVGIVGAYPGDGYTGYGISDVLVAAQGPLNCIPRVAAVTEADVVQIGVYWGLPGATPQDSMTGCRVDGALLQTVLIPIQLAAPIDGRPVVTFDGVPIAPVPVIE